MSSTNQNPNPMSMSVSPPPLSQIRPPPPSPVMYYPPLFPREYYLQALPPPDAALPSSSEIRLSPEMYYPPLFPREYYLQARFQATPPPPNAALPSSSEIRPSPEKYYPPTYPPEYYLQSCFQATPPPDAALPSSSEIRLSPEKYYPPTYPPEYYLQSRFQTTPPPSPSPYSPSHVVGFYSPPPSSSLYCPPSRQPSPEFIPGVGYWYHSPSPPASASLFCPLSRFPSPDFIPGLGRAKHWLRSSPPAAAGRLRPPPLENSSTGTPPGHQPLPIQEVVGSLTMRELQLALSEIIGRHDDVSDIVRRFEEPKRRTAYVHELDCSLFGDDSLLYDMFKEHGEIDEMKALYSHISRKLSVSVVYNSTPAANKCIISWERSHLGIESCPDCLLF